MATIWLLQFLSFICSFTQAQQTVYIHDDRPNHLLHCLISIFCPWWILIWMCICCIYGC